MDIIELKEQIIKNKLSNFYIFTGEEIGIQKIYLNQISKVLGLNVIRSDSVADIYKACTTESIFEIPASIYVIRGDKDFQKNESLYTTIQNKIGKNVIILLYEKLDKRLNFGKFFKDCTVEFEKLAPNILSSYIKKACSLNDSNVAELSNKISGCYDLAMLEVDKIKNFSKVLGKDDNYAFEELCRQGVIYQPEEHNVFEFTDAVCSRRAGEALRIANNLSSNGVSAINTLGTLYNSMKTILLIQCCESRDICNVTGLDNRQIYFNKKYAGIYSTAELVQAVKLIAKTIDDIKNGWMDEKYAVLYIIVKTL